MNKGLLSLKQIPRSLKEWIWCRKERNLHRLYQCIEALLNRCQSKAIASLILDCNVLLFCTWIYKYIRYQIWLHQYNSWQWKNISNLQFLISKLIYLYHHYTFPSWTKSFLSSKWWSALSSYDKDTLFCIW